jgi:hypothetical protein
MKTEKTKSGMVKRKPALKAIRDATRKSMIVFTDMRETVGEVLAEMSDLVSPNYALSNEEAKTVLNYIESAYQACEEKVSLTALLVAQRIDILCLRHLIAEKG